MLKQLQNLAEVRRIFIAVETGFVRGDFEQDAAGCPEIDGPEIITVDDRCNLVTRVHQGLADFELLCAVLDGESDVVHRTCALPCERCFRKDLEVDRIRTIAAGDDEAGDGTIRFGALVAHEPKQFGRGSGVMQAELSTGEAADANAFVDA